MLFRAQVRNTALSLLQTAITVSGATFFTSKDTPVEADTGAPTREIIVYTDDRKTGLGGTPPQFKTEVLTVIEITVEDDSKDAAEAMLDTLCETVEDTLFGTPDFVKLFELIDSVETISTYKGVNAARHTFTSVTEIRAHATEIFEPTITETLKGVNVYVDSVNVFDPNGTYVPPFNYPVSDPQRPRGPDGRVEAGGKVEFGPLLGTENDTVIVDGAGKDILAT